MRHLRLLVILAFVGTLLVSCEKKMGMDDVPVPKKNRVESAEIVDMHMPVSTHDVPDVLFGENKGGNVTCLEVEGYYGFDFLDDDVNCNKVDYENFDIGFPDGLIVDVDEANKRLSFRIEGGCLEINGSHYKVGAVIVKGSNASNVYFYMDNHIDGVASDEDLGSPGGKALVSNLTFCFVPCKKVIAVKVKTDGLDTEKYWACTVTDAVNDDYIDYLPFVAANYKLYLYGNDSNPIGDLIIEDTNGDGVLDVTINNLIQDSDEIKDAHVFIGPASLFNTDYINYPNELHPNPATEEVFFNGVSLVIL